MARFISKLKVSPVPNSRLWITDAPFVVQSDLIGRFRVPKNFIFDGNSLPRVLWIVSVPTDCMEAGCIHDWLYQQIGIERKVADSVYREMLEVQGMGGKRATVRYWGLRLFGWHAFNKDQAASAAKAAAKASAPTAA